MRIDAYNQVAQLYGIQKNLKTLHNLQIVLQRYKIS